MAITATTIGLVENFTQFPGKVDSIKLPISIDLTWNTGSTISIFPPPVAPQSLPSDFKIPSVSEAYIESPVPQTKPETFTQTFAPKAQILDKQTLFNSVGTSIEEKFQVGNIPWTFVGFDPSNIPSAPTDLVSIVSPNGSVSLSWIATINTGDIFVVNIDNNETILTTKQFITKSLSQGIHVIQVQTKNRVGNLSALIETVISVPSVPTIEVKVLNNFFDSLSIGKNLTTDTVIPITRDDDKLSISFDHLAFDNFYTTNHSLLSISFDNGVTFQPPILISDISNLLYPIPNGINGLTRIVVRLKQNNNFVDTETIWLNIQPGITSM